MSNADLAPTEYIGQGIVPVNSSGIRMESAKVDIDWGEPGVLTGVFVMNNEEAGSVNVEIGFPVVYSGEPRWWNRQDFTMSFDGVRLDRASIRRGAPSSDAPGHHAETLWYDCRHVFPPGRTTVTVRTELPSSQLNDLSYRERLLYCVQTGAKWKGPIGFEEVAIHFPKPIPLGQIILTKPAGGAAEGNTVRWRFENFEPRNGDHDIDLWFLNPDVLPILTDLRRKLAVAPDDPRRMLNLVKHLLALTSARDSFPDPPEKIAPDEFREILSMIRVPEEHRRFKALFARSKDGFYREKGSDWTQHADVVTSILSAAGYVPRHGRSEYLAEARGLLARLLREYPHDADAWNVGLAYSTAYRETGGFNIYPFQIAQIKAALRNCPDDSAIRLWDTVSQLERQRSLQKIGGDVTELDRRTWKVERQLEDILEKRGLFKLRFDERGSKYLLWEIINSRRSPAPP